MTAAMIDLGVHHAPDGVSDRVALGFTKVLRWTADTFFGERYGHRAVVLETRYGRGHGQPQHPGRGAQHRRRWVGDLVFTASGKKYGDQLGAPATRCKSTGSNRAS